MEGAHYARNFMNKVPLKAGAEVLVYGASGSIGSAAVALLHDAGAVVTAVCPQQHHAAVLALGAARAIDYQTPDWLDEFGDGSFGYVFDAVGKQTRGSFLRVIRPDGFYVSSHHSSTGITTWARYGQLSSTWSRARRSATSCSRWAPPESTAICSEVGAAVVSWPLRRYYRDAAGATSSASASQ